jgi:cation-transporting ATPase 13A3/4/5
MENNSTGMKEAVSSPLLSILSKREHLVHCLPHRDAEDDNNILEVRCYKKSVSKTILFYGIVILSAGFVYWAAWLFQSFMIFLRFVKCSPENATYVCVVTDATEELVETCYKNTKSKGRILTFQYHCLSYYFNSNRFEPLYMDTHLTYTQLTNQFSSGIQDLEEIAEKQDLYGMCQMDVPLKSIPNLLISEILHPSVMLQLFGIVLWMVDGSRYYAAAVTILTIISLATSLHDTRKNLKSIRQMALYECPVRVFRSKEIEISSKELVPGDLIEIPEDTKMPCDVVLIGGSCVMDEALLTGESIGVLKESLPRHDSLKYDLNLDSRYSLYEGTYVIQTRSSAESKPLGIVTRTGFSTLKGKIIRSILFPKPQKFRFYEDSIKFILVLFGLSLISFIVTIPIQYNLGLKPFDIIDNSLNILTITVPVTLPSVMTTGSVFAIMRLRRQKIICISPPCVNIAGKVDIVLFDKTGTLTQEGMNFRGAIESIDSIFLDITPDIKELGYHSSRFVECMASCHALTKVNGEILGDPQDICIQEATGWEFLETEIGSYDKDIRRIIRTPIEETVPSINHENTSSELGVLHIFHFTSHLKRMGVVTIDLTTSKYSFYIKGAPEIVSSLCIPSTLPPNFSAILTQYSSAGYRVIACAFKPLPSINLPFLKTSPIHQIENQLIFLGLIILQNSIKPECPLIMHDLKEAGLNSIIVTGDAMLTSIKVGRECGMIDSSQDIYFGEFVEESLNWYTVKYQHKGRKQLATVIEDTHNYIPPWHQRSREENFTIAVTGKTYYHLRNRADSEDAEYKNIFELMLLKTKVYARMSPENKACLVEDYQSRGIRVCMCGDGSNDCIALKAAYVGISLSSSEASIAAPFTSTESKLESVLSILKEGRCALTTSLQCFKYMALYSLTEFVAITALYCIASNLADYQYIYIDILSVIPLSITMCYTGPYPKLAKTQPVATLMSFPVLVSVIGQFIIQCGAQLAVYLYVISQDFYEEIDADLEDLDNNYECYEDTVLFLEINFAFSSLCIISTIGKPWKMPAYHNAYFSVCIVVFSGLAVYFILWPAGWVRTALQLKELPWWFRWRFLCICIGYGVLSYIYEKFFIQILDSCRDVRSKRRKSTLRNSIRIGV